MVRVSRSRLEAGNRPRNEVVQLSKPVSIKPKAIHESEVCLPVCVCVCILCLYRQLEKNFLNSNISPTCPYNMVNFGPLAAKICWRVWSTPANFNGFRVLAD